VASKKIESPLARWEGVKRPSRSKEERIINKMGAAQCGPEEHKKYSEVGAREGERGEYCCFAKVYSCSSRARGLTNDIFFFINNRVLGD
jgi:hypothetical protein